MSGLIKKIFIITPQITKSVLPANTRFMSSITKDFKKKGNLAEEDWVNKREREKKEHLKERENIKKKEEKYKK